MSGDDHFIRPDNDEYRCPHCGKGLYNGYGFVGGGIGPYTFCEDCGVIDTFLDPEMTDEKA